MIISVQTLLLLIIALPFGAQANQPESLTIITLADSNRGSKNAVDIGPPGPSQGDLFVFDQPLMNEELQDIGNNSGYCINTLPSAYSQCQWTLTFTDASGKTEGSIVVAGQEHEVGTSVVAVIGSTGKYAGFTGHMSSQPNGDGTFTQTLKLSRP